MDVSSVASAAVALTQAQTGDAISTRVMRMALDAAQQNAATLVQALPEASRVSEGSLGRNVDIFA